MRRTLTLPAVFLACAWSAPALAHGTERHFGTPINSGSAGRETAWLPAATSCQSDATCASAEDHVIGWGEPVIDEIENLERLLSGSPDRDSPHP